MSMQFVLPEGAARTMVLRDAQRHGRPVYDLESGQSLCWSPYDAHPDWGFWSFCNLPLDVEGQATNHVHEMPKFARIQDNKPTRLAVVATQSLQPPLGDWVKGLPFQFEPQVPFWKTCGTLVEIKNCE